MKKTNAWFSIVEIMVGIFIFTAWLISIYLVIEASLRLVDDSRNKIVATNLAREWVELVKNIRNTNYNDISWWGHFDVDEDWIRDKILESEGYYIIENRNVNITNSSMESNLNINMDFLPSEPHYSISNIKDETWLTKETSLYIKDNIYSYEEEIDSKKTQFYRYIKISPIEYKETTSSPDLINGKAVQITSYVYWLDSKKIKHIEIPTIISNWKNY